MCNLQKINWLIISTLIISGCSLALKKDESPTVVQTGKVDRKGIRATISKHHRHVRNCYGKSLLVKGNEQLKGKIVVFFEIGPDGQAKNAKVNKEKSNIDSPPLSDCIIAGLKSWDFPVHPDGIDVGVNYPFVFRAAPPKNMQNKLDQFKKLKKGTY